MTTELATTRGTGDATSLTLLPPAQPIAYSARATLREHAQMMADARGLAGIMVGTQMVPARYVGKPDDAAIAMLYGAELGLNPIQSLQAVVPIHGMPNLEARTMAALLKSRGYKIRTTAQADDSVTVEGHDLDGETYTSTWTIERATRAGYVPRPASPDSRQRPEVETDWLTTTKTFRNGGSKTSVVGNMKYITDPRAMLKAKAIAEVCRDMAPDVLLGMPYAREDLESETFDAEPARAPRPQQVATERVDTVTVDETPAFANLIKTAPAADPVEVDESDPEPEPLAEPEVEPAAEAEPASEPEPAPAAPKTNAEITREKWMTRLAELLDDASVESVEDRLLVVAKVGGTAPLINLAALPDKQLRAAVNTLAAWSKAGELSNQVTDILNASFLAQMNADDSETGE